MIYWDHYNQLWVKEKIIAFISLNPERKGQYYLMFSGSYAESKEEAEELIKRWIKLEAFK